jgi:transcriptional regulator with XRE-family HTH domain
MGEVVKILPDLSDDEICPSPRQRDVLLDQEIGARLRTYRVSKRFSQEELAKSVGVSFQQIQKYEKATNRISVSMMLRLCAAMAIDPLEFVSGIEVADYVVKSDTIPIRDDVNRMLGLSGGLDMVRLYANLGREDRAMLRKLAYRMVHGSDDGEIT